MLSQVLRCMMQFFFRLFSCFASVESGRLLRSG
jgi:hypothetical protein